MERPIRGGGRFLGRLESQPLPSSAQQMVAERLSGSSPLDREQRVPEWKPALRATPHFFARDERSADSAMASTIVPGGRQSLRGGQVFRNANGGQVLRGTLVARPRGPFGVVCRQRLTPRPEADKECLRRRAAQGPEGFAHGAAATLREALRLPWYVHSRNDLRGRGAKESSAPRGLRAAAPGGPRSASSGRRHSGTWAGAPGAHLRSTRGARPRGSGGSGRPTPGRRRR